MQSGDDFITASARKRVDGFADDQGRRIALTNINLPLSCKRFRPCCRFHEAAGSAVTLSASPLRVIERGRLLRHCDRGSQE
jgi:hypothetical protein